MALAREPRRAASCSTCRCPTAPVSTLLDRLKRNPDTRHIPVHMVSVDDPRTAALELGAVGFALKPVARDELVKAIRKLRANAWSSASGACWSSRTTPQLRESTTELLQLDGVVIEASAPPPTRSRDLATQSYDCVVLDLNLPDASGYEILETMSAQRAVSFPPVIIYTGRDAVARRRGAAAPLSRDRSSSRARARRNGCSTRSRSFCTRSNRGCRRSRSGCCARRGERDELFEGRTILDRRRRRAQHLRADERVRAARGDGRHRAQRTRRHSSRSRAVRPRPGADGHHDAGDGRPDRDPRAAQGPEPTRTCRSSR